MRCASYIRVSTDKEEQKSSITNQKNIFINYIKENNWTLHDFYIDVETGTTGKRENLQRLIQDAKEKKFEVIIAKELSRLARNGSLSYQIRDIAQQNNIGIITLDGAINSINGDVSKYGLYTWLYEEESERTSGRVKSSLRARATKGLFKGSIPPYGYYAENGKLFLKSDQTPSVVKWIFEQYLEGRGFDSIAKELFVSQAPSPSEVAKKANASPKWYGSGVRSILENPHYTGNLIQQRETTVSVTNKKRVKSPEDKTILVRDTHEPIISEELFQLVQDLMAHRAKKKNASGKHLFSNLMTCADCGSTMHYKVNRKGYVCGGYIKLSKKFCTHHAVKEKDLVRAVLTDTYECSKAIINPETNEKVAKLKEQELKKITKKMDRLNIRIKAVQNKKSKLLNLLVDETISKEEYQSGVTKYDEEINYITNEKSHLDSLLKKGDSKKDLKHLQTILEEINTKQTLTNSTVNKLVKSVKIQKDGTPEIEYRFKTLSFLNEIKDN